MRSILVLFLTFPLLLCAAVKVSVKNDTALLDNGIIRAQFTSKGGKMISLTAFGSKKNLVLRSKSITCGALKDQFAPKDFALRSVDYIIKAATLPDGSGELTFSTPGMDGDWFFLSLVKKITLAPGSSRLDVSVTINNKLERMSPFVFTYWSHNFFGVPGEDNIFIYPGKDGVASFVPSTQNNRKQITDAARNFIAMLGPQSRMGVVMLPEYSELDRSYSWYCKATSTHDTLEFRLIQDKVDNGSSITKRFSVAVLSQLENLSGAGQKGAGYIKHTPEGIKLFLTGFAKTRERFQLYIDGKRHSSFTASLAPGKLFTRTLGSKSGHYRVVSKDFDMEFKCDAQGKSLPLALKPMGKKRPAVISEKDLLWQMDPSTEYVTPHFVWQTGGKKHKALFLVPANGSRDIVELQQRLKLAPVAPTLFPGILSWQTVTELHSQETGLEKLDKYLKHSYDMIVVGAYAGVHRGRHGRGSWSSYPAAVRKKLLQMSRNGAGLMILGAGNKDKNLNKIRKALPEVSKDILNSMSFSAAPMFPEAKIRMGKYGKGRIVIIDFPRDNFIVPHPGYRGSAWKNPVPQYRFQEYQFAIIGRLMLWSAKQGLAFRKISAADGKLQIDAASKGSGYIEIFDSFTCSYHRQKIDFVPGENSFKLPSLRHGINYIHVTANSGDFGYACADGKQSNFIKKIDIVNNKSAIKGEVFAASKLKNGESFNISIVDNLDRLLYTSESGDGKFAFAPETVLTNRHEVRAQLLKNGKVCSEMRKDFYLPALRNTIANYTNMLWLCGDNFPLYSYKYRYKQYSEFGFNFHYSGSGNNGMLNIVRHSDAECGSNGHGCTMIFYFRNLADGLKKYTRTNDKKFLIRGRCPNDPKYKDYLASDSVSQRMDEYGTRKVFQLGDEMSMTFHHAAFDICMCQYCMAEFREIQRKKYGTIEKLNAEWDCKFKSFEELYPLTFGEAILKDNRAPYLLHRRFMDEVFRRTLNGYRERLQKKYPGSAVGPTGINGIPSPYNGNSNFYSMKDFECASFYRDTRFPVSFNREKRLVMRYRGYSDAQESTLYSFWEGIALGERGNNSWFGPVFQLPDLRLSKVRKYYSDLLWELRGGMGDLFYHSKKLNTTAAILHSQNSLIINFTKERKTGFYEKEKDFARILEDLAIPHRFIAPEELDKLDDFKILCLPESSALSDAAVAKITDFVQKGGILIADVEPASFDELGRKRKTPALDKLFGADTKAASLRKTRSSTFKTLPVTYACRGVKAAGAKAEASAKVLFGKAPLWLENRSGKGKTLLLNFVTDYTRLRKNGSAAEFLNKMAGFLNTAVPGKVVSKRPVMHGAFADKENLYFVMLPELLTGEKSAAPFTAPFILDAPKHLYDVRQGKYLGHGKSFNVSLTPGNGTVLAALPYKVKSVSLKLSGKNRVSVSVTAEKNSVRPNGILTLKCFPPDGKEMKIYRQTVKYENGKAQFSIPFALNEKSGKWQINVTDAASGVSANISVRL